MIILVGESASGKSTIEKELCKNYNYQKIISYTTRPPRQGEVDGIDYHFISKEKFHELHMNNFFAEIGCYRDWWYGSAIIDCNDTKIAVLTPHGLRQMKAIDNLNITSFYISIPRRDRMIKMLQRGDEIEECYRRSLSDVGQFDGIQDEVDFIIYNDGYKKSAKTLADEIMVFMKAKEEVNGET